MKFNTIFRVLLCSLSIVYGFCKEVNAQYNSKETDFAINQIAKTPTFPSPDAQPFTENAKASVNYFNGSLNVNVPIYTISTGHLEIPISVNYNCNGIKVNDISTRAGIGWMLSTGGVVTRTMYGRPDEKGLMVDFENVNWSDPTSAIQAMQVVCNGGDDSQYDLFSYNYPGGSGKFSFDMNGNPFLIPQTDEKIEMQKNGIQINGFIITAIDGIQYHFFANEKTTMPPLSNSGTYDINVTTAWYLTKIKHPMNDSILFFYSNPGGYGYSVGMMFMNTYSFPNTYSICECETGYNPVSLPQSTTIFPCRLDSIVSATCTMNFTYEALGSTIPKERLSGITIFDNTYTEFNHFDFYHSIFGERLFLDSIVRSSNENSYPPYCFDYFQKTSMPARLNNGQDLFGFYNGKYNETLLTRDGGEYYGLFDGWPYADRTYSFNHSRIGMLQKITYPTGGYSVVDYEPHHSNEAIYQTSFNNRSFGPINVSSTQGSSTGEIDTTFSISQNGMIKLWMKKVVNNTSNASKAIFTIDDTLSYTIDCDSLECERSAFYYLESGIHSLNIFVQGHKPQLICEGTANIYLQETDSVPVFPKYGIRVKKITNIAEEASPPSIQRIFYTPFNDTSEASLMPINLPQFFKENQHYKFCQGFIEPYDVLCTSVVWNANSIIPTFPYGNDFCYDKVTLSNGEYFENGGTQFNFVARRNSVGQVLVPPNELVDGSLNQKDWINGTKISELTFDKNLNILVDTRFKYSENDEQILNNYDIRQICPGYLGYYNPNDRLYDYAAQKSQYYSVWLRLDSTITKEYFNGSNTPMTRTKVSYFNDPGSKQVTKELITGSDRTQTSEIFYPTMFSQSGTSGAAAAISEMKSQHIINKAIETVQSIKYPNMTEPSVIDAQVSMYKIDDGVVIPDKVHKLESVSPISQSGYQYSIINGSGQFQYDNRVIEQVKYDLFDETGNLIQYHEINNIPVTLIWGYGHNYPIAKIDNATFDEVVNMLIAINNNYTIEYLQNLPENELIAIFNLLRAHVNMSDALVTSYTHQMLKGISSSTDPDGKTTYYDYDPFGRLETVRDQNIHTIKHVEYNYSNSENKRR